MCPSRTGDTEVCPSRAGDVPRALQSPGKQRQDQALWGWKSGGFCSCCGMWRKPPQGSDPDVLGCLQAQDAGGFAVGMVCNKWIRKNEHKRKQEGKKKSTKFSVKIDISIYSWAVMILQKAASSSDDQIPFSNFLLFFLFILCLAGILEFHKSKRIMCDEVSIFQCSAR